MTDSGRREGGVQGGSRAGVLRALADRVEKCRGVDRDLDGLVAIEFGWSSGYQGDGHYSCPQFTRDYYAAMELVDGFRADETEMHWRVYLERKPTHGDELWFATIRQHGRDGWEGMGRSTAQALCAAALRAMAASHENASPPLPGPTGTSPHAEVVR